MTSPEARLSSVTSDLSPGPAWASGLDGVAHLNGTRCPRCHMAAFPSRAVCHRCGGVDLAPAEIGPRGRLYTWTTVHVSGRRPAPYTLGYIDLPEDLRVLALVQGDTGSLHPGMAMRLVTAGGDLVFAPAGGEAG
jgi:uncharacterized protein